MPPAPTFWDTLATAPVLTTTLAAVFGLLVGSFLNVVILRWPLRLMWRWKQDARDILGLPREPDPAPDDLVKTGSRCPHCKHRLAWWENIPLVSFALLRGRCRSCKTALSWQYPVVELLGAAVGVAAVAVFGPTPHALVAMGVGWALLALSGIDARTMLLPDPLVYVVLWSGLLVSAGGWAHAIQPTAAITGAAAGYLSLWLVFWAFKIVRGKEGMGYGDFKLLAALGAWLGPTPLLSVVLLATISGALAGVGVLWRKGHAATPYPFGPFLAFAGFVELLCPGWLWRLVG